MARLISVDLVIIPTGLTHSSFCSDPQFVGLRLVAQTGEENP